MATEVLVDYKDDADQHQNQNRNISVICFLCSETTQKTTISIKNPNLEYDPVFLISKYFWFEPDEHLISSSLICLNCWNVLRKFHILYVKVEELHRIPIEKHESNLGGSHSDLIKEEEFDFNFNDHWTNEIDEQDTQIVTNLSVVPQPETTLLHEITSIEELEGNDLLPLQTETQELSSNPTEQFVNKKLKNISDRTKQSEENDNKVSSFMTLTCDLCSIVLLTFGKLKTHFHKVHNLNGYAVCCKRKFYKRSLLIDHIDTHLNPEHFKCPTCAKVFTNKESHQTHLRTFHLPDRAIYECDKCPKKFSWRYVLIAHKKTHTPKEEWTYKCKDCDKIFASHTFLSSHRHYVHTVTKKICDLCGKCVSSRVFRKHQLTHSAVVQPKVQCEICGNWLNKKYIKTHLKNHEEFGTDHVCVQCGKRSPNSKALYKHIYEVHTLKKTLKCNVCDKTFKSKDLLAQHMPVHTGENNFTCPYCPRTFKFKSNAHDHRKKEHCLQYQEERKLREQKGNLKSIETAIVENEMTETSINI